MALEVHLFRQLVSSQYKVDSSRKRKRSPRPGETIERASVGIRSSSWVLFRQGYTHDAQVALHQLGSNEFGDKWPEIPANM